MNWFALLAAAFFVATLLFGIVTRTMPSLSPYLRSPSLNESPLWFWLLVGVHVFMLTVAFAALFGILR